ncbi:GNAT family N-acetyltransferase [Novosphingobium sp.]|uniref:GNAT family N-acetyltransferase n=1 Tax=Novosphingobium sp. TaxID=1874826 RepID=UPI002736E4A6|nr:GNAT family N-acetyltransferase [Novosphingobium sp.]MDP3906502.1 GNAT family N-acetyltransferase [Novosphingobium sp.]
MELILRAATPADIPALSRLATDSFIAKFGQLYSAENLNAFLAECLSEAAIAAELADPARIYRLAEASGRLVGYCKIGLTCGFPDHARGSNVMELKQLYTDPDATGMGIGGALMDWAMGEFAARAADEVQISVYAYNDGAHRFYRRYGFDKVADITFRVGDHIDPEFLFAQVFQV